MVFCEEVSELDEPRQENKLHYVSLKLSFCSVEQTF